MERLSFNLVQFRKYPGDLKDKTIVFLHRGMPINIFFYYKYIYNKGYSHSIAYGKRRKYEYIILMPLNNKMSNRKKEKLDKENFEDGYYSILNNNDAELNSEERQHKVDSLETANFSKD